MGVLNVLCLQGGRGAVEGLKNLLTITLCWQDSQFVLGVGHRRPAAFPQVPTLPIQTTIRPPDSDRDFRLRVACPVSPGRTPANPQVIPAKGRLRGRDRVDSLTLAWHGLPFAWSGPDGRVASHPRG